MNQIINSKSLQYQKRPIILTAFCVWYLLTFILNLVELLIPSGYSAAISRHPAWFIVTQLIILYPIGIASILGVWFMRRWGFFVFCASILFSWLLMIIGLNLLPQTKALLLALAFFVTGLIYLSRMK